MNNKIPPITMGVSKESVSEKEYNSFESIYKFMIEDRKKSMQKQNEELKLEEAAKNILHEAGYPSSWVEILSMFENEEKLNIFLKKIKFKVFK